MTLLMDDRSLLAAFKRGDREALTKVYRAYVDPLAARLYGGFEITVGQRPSYFKGLKAPWALESAVQEIFLKAFREPARLAYEGLRPYKSYLFTIARNHVIDQYRKNRRLVVGLDSELQEALQESADCEPSSMAHPEHFAADRELERLVEGFLDGLRGGLKELFQVRFFEGCSVRETALRLDISEYFVKRDEKILKRRFFKLMQKHGYLDHRSDMDPTRRRLLLWVFLTTQAAKEMS